MRGTSRNTYKAQAKNRRVVAFLVCFVIVISVFFAFDRYAGSYANLADKLGVPSTSRRSNSTANEKSDPKKEDSGDDLAVPLTPQRSTSTESEKSHSKKEGTKTQTAKHESKISCNFADERSDICKIDGEIRIHGSSSSVSVISSEDRTWKLQPYAHKNDAKIMSTIPEVTVTSLNGDSGAPRCNIRHGTTAVIFALQGLTEDKFQYFEDILLPLYRTTRQLKGEVQFLVMNYDMAWIKKYENIIKMLSRHGVIDFAKERIVHCYPHAIVGLHFQEGLSIDSSTSPNNHSMVDFAKFIRTAYKLNREFPMTLGENPWQKPKLLILSSNSTGKITNLNEVSTIAEDFGFIVVIKDSYFVTDANKFPNVVNECDVLLGVYSSELTDMVFLPTNAVVIQVVPYGNIQKKAEDHFKLPAIEMNLRYLQYNIDVEESTLTELYPRDHAVFKDLESIEKEGSEAIEEIYLKKQNVKLNVMRFRPVLLEALNHLSP